MSEIKPIHHPEIGDLPRWDLTHIYPSADAKEIDTDKRFLAEQVTKFVSRYEGGLSTLDAEPLADAVQSYENIYVLKRKLSSYAYLLEHISRGNEKNGQVVKAIRSHLDEQDANLAFFSLELNKLDQQHLNNLLKSSERLCIYTRWLQVVRLKKDHELSTEIERFVAEHNKAAHAALLQIYNARLEKITYQVDGKTLRQDNIISILAGEKDESIRKKAALALSHGLGSEQELFATILDAIVQDKRKMDIWRRYLNPSDDRHLENQIEPEVIGTLVTSVRASYADLSHRYYVLKAKWLNKEQLDPWDRIAPLPFSKSNIIPFASAKKIVLGAYRDFSPLLAAYLEDAFQQNLIDVPSVPGKTSGAFSHPTTLGIPSYMLINYLGQPRNVVTLAHEGGHYVHQVLSKNAQPPLLAQTPLTLAETASVFGEMLTFKSLQAQETDLDKRMAMTAEKVERMLNTVIRQVAFYEFECRVHEKGKDAPLTSDVINEIWQTTMAESHGPALRQDKLYDPYWCYVHHFFESPFYVYAYAFGDCLVNSLYGVYESEKTEGRGEDFAQKYIDLLKAGGSKTYNDLLVPFGLDAKDPGFWKRGLDVIGRFIDELELLDIERTAHPDQRKGEVKVSTAAPIDKLLLG